MPAGTRPWRKRRVVAADKEMSKAVEAATRAAERERGREGSVDNTIRKESCWNETSRKGKIAEPTSADRQPKLGGALVREAAWKRGREGTRNEAHT